MDFAHRRGMHVAERVLRRRRRYMFDTDWIVAIAMKHGFSRSGGVVV